MKWNAFFKLAAEELAPRLELTPEQLAGILKQREEESSTLLSESLAVAHVVVEGEGRFEMLIARVKVGVRFSEKAPEVKTVFVLTPARDERNFHLRSLVPIAQVVYKEDFARHHSSLY